MSKMARITLVMGGKGRRAEFKSLLAWMSTNLSMKYMKAMEFLREDKGLEEILGEMEEIKGQ